MSLFDTRFENDTQYLKPLCKRIDSLADENAIPNTEHHLWIKWSNLKAMLNPSEDNYYQEVMYFTMVMAKHIDEHAKSNMLDGDQTIARILHELDSLKVCDYKLLEV